MKHGELIANNKEAPLQNVKHFQEMVGSTMFAMIETRADIAFAISISSRFARNPSKAHIEALKTIL